MIMHPITTKELCVYTIYIYTYIHTYILCICVCVYIYNIFSIDNYIQVMKHRIYNFPLMVEEKQIHTQFTEVP